jgi:RNA polymerase sigma factor (sigma-70 family)
MRRVKRGADDARDPSTTPSSDSDEALMAAYIAGDRAAHRALFDRLGPQLFGLARRQLRDDAEAEDVVQRTFLQLHRARHDFRPGARVRPWLFTIAMNLVRDAFRRRTRQRENLVGLDGDRALEPGPRKTAPDRLPLERREDAALVHRALASLPADQRRAIELHWLEERPFAEIAQIVGASVSAVKVRAHRGYKKMRAFVETEEDSVA